MKRVRTEQVQVAVSCYLRRRQYVDSEGPLKQGLRLSQTPEEMAANLTGIGALWLSWNRSCQCPRGFLAALRGTGLQTFPVPPNCSLNFWSP